MLQHITHRKVTSIEWVYYEGFVTNMYDTADAVAGVEGSTGTWIIFNCSVIIAMLNVLKKENKPFI